MRRRRASTLGVPRVGLDEARSRPRRQELGATRSDAQLILGHALAVASPSEAQAAYENGRRTATDDDTRARFLIAQGWLHYMHGDLARAAQTYQQGVHRAGARSTT